MLVTLIHLLAITVRVTVKTTRTRTIPDGRAPTGRGGVKRTGEIDFKIKGSKFCKPVLLIFTGP